MDRQIVRSVRVRRRAVGAAAALALLAGLATAPPAYGGPGSNHAVAGGGSDRTGVVVEPGLHQQLAAGGETEFWVYLHGEPDLAPAGALAADRAAQGRYVHEELTGAAARSQAGLRALLDRAGAPHTPFWITNAVKVTGDQQLLAEIIALPEVAEVTADRVYELPEPEPAPEQPLAGDVEWGVDRVNAPQVWEEFEARGEEIVVGVIDTGARYTHEALVDSYRGNLGGGEFDHHYSWHDPSRVCGDPSPAPCDNHGHGTHVTGTITGSHGIGVAPAARWIAAKGCEGATCSQQALLSAGQFMLAPTDLTGAHPRPELRPHIVNNSWGSDRFTDPWYRELVQAWVAAGIFPQFAAGNNGPGCGTAGNPGNLPESYAAGAFDIDGEIADFSSRGPSAWGGIRKPDLTAPGVAIRSASHEGEHDYRAASGTSMASPHVAGAVALLWSAAPALVREIAATRAVLDTTAIDTEDLSCGGTPQQNHVWGQGKLDARAAVAAAPLGPAGRLAGTVTGADTGEPLGGATIAVSGEVEREFTAGADGSYTVVLPTGEYTVTGSGFGYADRAEPATIVADETTTVDLLLSRVDHVTVSGRVTDGSGQGWPLYARVSAAGTPVAGFTDPATGEYRLSLPAGDTYQLQVEPQYPGYAGAAATVPATDDATADFALAVEQCLLAPGYAAPVTVGILGDQLNGVAFALDQQGLPHHTFNWGDDPAAYEVIVVNRPSDPGEAAFLQFLADTDAAGTGVVFLDNWGSFADGGFGGAGGIWLLEQYAGNPAQRERVNAGTGVAELSYRVRAEHPVVAGFEVGEDVLFDDTDAAKVYTWFDGYQGDGRQVIADISRSDTGPVGPGIGVQQREHNRHVLLSAHGASQVFVSAGDQPGERPADRPADRPQHWDPRNWAEPGAQLFRNAVEWVSPVSLDCVAVEGGLVLGEVTDRNTGEPVAGATVSSVERPDEAATSAASPDDPALSDGFFWLFSSQTGEVEFSAAARRYVEDRFTVPVVAGAANPATPSLPAGRLEVDREQLVATLREGQTAQRELVLSNTGTAPVEIELYERRGGPAAPAAPVAAASPAAGTAVQYVEGEVSPAAPALLDLPAAGAETGASGVAADPWLDLPGYPQTVMDNAMAVVDGQLYSFGGWSRQPIGPGIALDDAHAFDPETQLWQRIASLPEPRTKPEAAAIDGLIYVIGGWDGDSDPTTSTYIYDPGTDSWSQGADLPAGRAAPGVAVLDGQLYAVGGCTDSGCSRSSTVWRYDPGADAWESLADYPETTSWLACGGLAGEVHCAGGTGGASGPSHATYAYDPDQDSWTARADLPYPVWGMAYAAAGGRLVLSAGVTAATATNAVTNRSVAYHPGTDTWTELAPARYPLYRMGGACGFYKVGGTTAAGVQHTSAERHPDFWECEQADLPWLAVDPPQAVLAPGEQITVTVTVDGGAVDPGSHTGGVGVWHETPYWLAPVAVALNLGAAVECDRTVSGTHRGPLAVTGGITCLAEGAEVRGPVTVGPDAGLYATGATIHGPVTATGAALVELAGGEVNGAVAIRETTGSVQLTGVRVSGAVALSGNTTADGPVIVSGNVIAGPLACTGNQPAPVNEGVPNQVTGSASGQCAQL